MSSSPPIQILAEKLKEARGAEHRLTYLALKRYVSKLNDVAFLAEMSRVDNPGISNDLWSIGLTRRQQEIVAYRWKELTL